MANQFRVSSRAASTALDVLPLASVGASVEVKEHVEWMARQARKAGYEVDPDDIRVVEAVKPVLAELEKGVAPGKARRAELRFKSAKGERIECLPGSLTGRLIYTHPKQTNTTVHMPPNDDIHMQQSFVKDGETLNAHTYLPGDSIFGEKAKDIQL
ncbi:hypothetical protein ACFX15_008504 [Malus domestica]